MGGGLEGGGGVEGGDVVEDEGFDHVQGGLLVVLEVGRCYVLAVGFLR